MKTTHKRVRQIIKEEISRKLSESRSKIVGDVRSPSMRDPHADFELIADFDGMILYNNLANEQINLNKEANWTPEDGGGYIRRAADIIAAEAKKYGVTELWDSEEQGILSIEDVVTSMYRNADEDEGVNEEISRKLSEGISSTPTGRLEVEWDFEMDDDPEWNALSYEEKVDQEGIPYIIQVSPDIMEEFMSISSEESSAEADYMINDWLSDEFGWLHQGWNWVDDPATQGSAPDPEEDEEAYAAGRPWEHN